MSFLVDAQLPRRIVYRLREHGHDTLHTFDLQRANRTPDSEVAAAADSADRVLVSKDGDFVISHVLVGVPARLLLVSTGNVPNVELEHLVVSNLGEIVQAFDSTTFVELTRTGIILRER